MNAPYEHTSLINPDWLQTSFDAVRRHTMRLAAPLSAEDCCVQSMPDASPVKWHLAHTTWFFETFVLERFEPDFIPHHPAFRVLFNSYYNGVGDRHERLHRGLLTRPSHSTVLAYRADVDRRVTALLEVQGRQSGKKGDAQECASLIALGLEHEQQHQELMMTDIKHLLSCNPTDPAYLAIVADAGDASLAMGESGESGATPDSTYVAQLGGSKSQTSRDTPPVKWFEFEPGVVVIGNDEESFCFDNETPRHRHFLEKFELASRLVTNGEYLAFMEAGGYREPGMWMSEGWQWVCENALSAPLYWRRNDGTQWMEFTLHGAVELDLQAPVTHVSLFEADAYARWVGARLPTEAEWEHAASMDAVDKGGAAIDGVPARTPGLEPGTPFMSEQPLQLHPNTASHSAGLSQLYDHCWQWTSSSYAPYPGYLPLKGALGEYNGKFMINQYVLRGSSCTTPQGHSRSTYRNFFPASTRWQFSGIRLGRSSPKQK